MKNKIISSPTKQYQILRELGHNYEGGRRTLKALDLENHQLVVIKHFRFISSQQTWKNLKVIQREIEVLRHLDHPNIPDYLNSFEDENGLYLVQEYKEAKSLNQIRSFSLDEIKYIAEQILTILVYLQQQNPPIFHRDIKPENILIEKIASKSSSNNGDNPLQLPLKKGKIPPHSPLKKGGGIKVYLVDFGLAKEGGNTSTALSSVMVGTPGFMSPEQLLNKPLTKSSDLYGLGMTLICLLTGKKSTEVEQLVNDDFTINFKPYVKNISFCLIQWIEKLVKPNLKNRFESAEIALSFLNQLEKMSYPRIKTVPSSLSFECDQWGKIYSQTLKVINLTPNRIIQGKWEVDPHLSDPPHTPDHHAWISINLQKFEGNEQTYKVTINTKSLSVNQLYERQLRFHTKSLGNVTSILVTTIVNNFKEVSIFLALKYVFWSGLWLGITLLFINQISGTLPDELYLFYALVFVVVVFSILFISLMTLLVKINEVNCCKRNNKDLIESWPWAVLVALLFPLLFYPTLTRIMNSIFSSSLKTLWMILAGIIANGLISLGIYLLTSQRKLSLGLWLSGSLGVILGIMIDFAFPIWLVILLTLGSFGLFYYLSIQTQLKYRRLEKQGELIKS